jgi:hypothetical protein
MQGGGQIGGVSARTFIYEGHAGELVCISDYSFTFRELFVVSTSERLMVRSV